LAFTRSLTSLFLSRTPSLLQLVGGGGVLLETCTEVGRWGRAGGRLCLLETAGLGLVGSARLEPRSEVGVGGRGGCGPVDGCSLAESRGEVG